MGARGVSIYMMADRHRGTLYVGVTDDLCVRVTQHRDGTVGGLADRYGLRHLVWFDTVPTAEVAAKREKSLKRWRRDWKVTLVERFNPQWDDLGPTIGLPPLDG